MKRASLFRLSPLLALALLLIGALALFTAPPAQAQNTDATLSGLAAEGGTISSGTFSSDGALVLNPILNSVTTSYTVTSLFAGGGPNTNTHVKLTPTTRNTGATVEVGKGNSLTAVTSGSASAPIALELGENAITVKVTAADGTTTKTYTVTVTRGSDAGKPTNVSLTAGNGSVTLTWDQAVGGPLASDVTLTEIEYGEIDSENRLVTGVRQSAVYASRDRTGRTWSVSGLTNGKIYSFRLRLPAYGEVPASAWTPWQGISLPSQQSNDAILSNLVGEWVLSGGTSPPMIYQPLFSLSTTYYSVRGSNVNEAPHIRLTPTTRNSGATVEVGKGDSLTAVTSGEASGLIALAPGENFITVKVTAADGTTKTYTLLVLMDDTPAQAQNTDATLSGLTAEAGVIVSGTFSSDGALVLNPILNSVTTSYTVTSLFAGGGPNTNTHVKLTPTTRNTGATVEVGKGNSLTAVTSGSASAPIALELGENAITVKVTAADGTTTKTYTVTVTRGSDAGKPTNVSLTAGNGSVMLTWDQAVGGRATDVVLTEIEYGEIDSDNRFVTGVRQSAVYASRDRTGRTWSVSGLTNGKIYSFRLRLPAYGEVPASAWTPWQGISLPSQQSNDAILSNLVGEWVLSGGTSPPMIYQPLFSLSTTYYSVRGSNVNEAPHIRLTPTTRNSGATVEVGKGDSLTAVTSGEASGLIALAPGENFITVKVTAADGTTKTYTLLVLMDDTPARAPAAPANLEVDAADGQLALSWTAPSGTVTGYDVHYTSAPATGNGAVANSATASGSDPATAWVAVTRSGTTASQTISSLTNGATYRVRVRATNSGGSSAWVFESGTPRINLRWPSSTLELAENATTASEIRISEGGATVSSAVSGTLTYSAGSSNPASLTEDLTSGYATTFSAAANAIPTIVLAAPANDAVNEEHETFTVTLNAGTGYTVGTPSTLTVTIIDNDPPAAPPLTLTTGNGQQRASWTKPAGPVTGYQLRYKEATATDQAATTAGDPSTGWVTSTPSGTGTSADITGLTNNTTYLVQVRATDGQTQTGNGWGAWSASQSGRPTTQASNADLLGLTAESSTSASGTFSALTLSPSPFAAATTAYTATVRNAVTHVKLFPARNDSDATVEVGKQGETLTAVPSSGESDAIALAVGANAVTVKVTAPDGSTTKTYTVTVTRGQPSTNAALSGLTATQAESASGTFTALTLDPSFAPAATAYTATVGSAITHLKLRPTASDSYATVEVGKGSSLSAVTNGQPSGPIALSFGANAITVKVTAENGSATKTYTVTVTRAMAQPSGAPPAAAAAVGTAGAPVSNTGQVMRTEVDFDNQVHAQAFTTGPYVDGYHLTGIEAIFGIREALTSEDAATVKAELWSDRNGTPGSRLVYMTARNLPTGVTGNHTVTFTPAYGIPATLAANTTYHFVIYTTGSLPGDKLVILLTRSTAEDAGVAEGWSIADQRSSISQNTPPWIPSWTTSTDAVVHIAVKGKPVSITHWTSTLAVKDLGPLSGDGCIGQQQCSDQLSPDSSFTYGGWQYNVLAVRVVRGSLQILLDKELPVDSLRLDVGDRQFSVKDASESWGIDRNEDAWRLTWHGTGLDWSDGDEVSVSLVGRNVPAPPTPAPNTDLRPVRVHYDEMRDGEPVDNFNNLRLASPKPSMIPGTSKRRVALRAYVPGTFPSSDPAQGMVTTTHVMLRVTAHPASALEWAIGNVYGVTGTFAAFANGGFTPAIALNPASKWTYVYIRVTNGSQSATHLVAIDPPPRTYTLSPEVSVTEGEEAALSLSLGSPAGAGGVSFTVSADYPNGGATAEDVGEIAATLTVPEGQQSARIIIHTVDDEAVEEDEEHFTVRVTHVGEPAWAVDPEGTDTAVVTIVDNDEPPEPPEGPEPWDIRVVPGDGTLTVTWNVGSRDGVEASEIWHVLRWSQEPGVWANPRDPRAVGKNDGLSVDSGLTSYTITDLRNGVATGVFVRSMVGHRNNMSERDGNSSKWVRVKGEHTTPVAPPNAAPTVSAAIADATIGNESGTHQVALSGVFTDADADGLTITAASSDTAVATVSVAVDYSTLTVTAQARGRATVTVTAADGYGGEAADTFTVTVKAAPSVSSPIADVSELQVDATHEVSMSGVFSDADGDAVTVTEASSSDSAVVAVSTALDPSTSAITGLTVLARSEGTATVTVTAQDADGNTVQDAFDVTVPAAQQLQKANNPPTVSAAIADATITNESGTHGIPLSGVFSDVDEDDLTITATSSDESVVTVSVSADYSTLTVTAKARGTATVTVTAEDGKGGSVEDNFTVKVKAAPTVASAIADISGLEGGDSRTILMSGVFSDADGDTVTVTQASSSDTSIAAVSAAIDGSTAAITAVTVTANSEGTVTITVTARDADGNTVSEAFDVTVNAPAAQQQKVNNPPTVSSAMDDATIVNESSTRQVSLSGVFNDADGDALTVTAGSSDGNTATVSVSADYSTLTVSAKGRGTAVITVTAEDGYGGSVEDSFAVRVKAAPVVASAIADISELEAGDSRVISLSGAFSDADEDALTITASSSNQATATVSVSADHSTLTVAGVAEGMATITVTAQDADGNRVSDSFTVTVSAPANNPPTVSSAIPDATIVSESGTQTVSLTGVFDDADGDDLTVTASSSDESVATASVSADFSTLTLTAQGRGTATITVTAADGYGGSVKDGFTVTVKAAPVVAQPLGDVIGLEPEATHEVSMSGAFSDGDGDSLTITASSADGAAATVSVSADHSTLTVAGVSEGTATITVTAQDADGNRVSDSFTVTVSAPANNPPTVSSAIADATIVNESGTHGVSLTGVFDDADDLTITAASSDESRATVSVATDQSTLTVSAKSRGTATITVNANDGKGGTVDDTFTVTVKAAPTVASAIGDVSELEVDATHEVSMSGVFSDPDGDAVTVTQASSSDTSVAAVSAAIDGSTAAITAITVFANSEGKATITVTAKDSDGNTVSDAFDVTVNAPAAQQQRAVELPGPVLGLELTATHDSVSVSWSAPESGDAPDGYIVNIKRQGGGDGETRRPGAEKTSLTFRGLNGGSTYEVWVRAENEAGKGERTHATVTLPSVLPGPVTGLEVAATADTVTVSWSAPETGGAPDGYIVHLKPEDGGKGRTKTPRAKKTRVSFDNLESGKTYEVWVRAQNTAGKGERVHASITLP